MTLPVLVVSAGEASGLAELLQQYLEQSLAASPKKAASARRARGTVWFRPVEDEAVCVRVDFTGERVELRDDAPNQDGACVRADFLSLAHLATGRESPLLLMARRRVRLRCPMRELPFLVRVLDLMQIDDPARRAGRVRLAVVLTTAAAAIAGALWFVTR